MRLKYESGVITYLVDWFIIFHWFVAIAIQTYQGMEGRN